MTKKIEKANTDQARYCERISELWLASLDLFATSPNKQKGFYKLISLTNFFIRSIAKIEYLIKENEQLIDDINNNTKTKSDLLKKQKQIKALNECWQDDKVFYKMKSQIISDYDRMLDIFLKDYDDDGEQILNFKTGDELLDEAIENIKKKIDGEDTSNKQLKELAEANKFLLLNDL